MQETEDFIQNGAVVPLIWWSSGEKNGFMFFNQE